jgi:hypothetical protein
MLGDPQSEGNGQNKIIMHALSPRPLWVVSRLIFT